MRKNVNGKHALPDTKSRLFAIILAGLLCGCGVKGPPVPPGHTQLPVVRDLAYQVSGNELVLSWTIPGVSGTPRPRIDRAGVYRLKQPLGQRDCPECPQTFERVTRLSARSGTMTYTDTISPGFQYYYKIVLSDRTDRSGGDSNIVHYIHAGTN